MKLKLLEKNGCYNLYETDTGVKLAFIKNSNAEYNLDQTHFSFIKSDDFIAINFSFNNNPIFQVKSLKHKTFVLWIYNLSLDLFDLHPNKELIALNSKIRTEKYGVYDTFLSENEIVSFPEQLGMKENGMLENEFYFIDPNLKIIKMKIEDFEELFK